MAQRKPENVHHDHRERMKERVDHSGFDGLSEFEALEYLLYYAIPRVDTNPIAHNLIDRFGSFAGVLEASAEELRTVPGVGESAARYIHSLYEADKLYAMSRSRERKAFDNTKQIAEYVAGMLRGAHSEKLLMVLLDDRKRLIRTSVLSDGSSGSVEVSMRRITAEAIGSGAAYAVLAHNHPDGIPLPSNDDVKNTSVIARQLASVEVRLLDHIVVAGEEWVSMHDTHRI